MSEEPIKRRRTHVEMPVSYAAVGATRNADVVRFPPDGATPYEESLRLGSGSERFLLASSLLMTWGAQRGGGFEILEVTRGRGADYEGVDFDSEGRPQTAGQAEDKFGPDGEPYITSGTSAVLRARDGADRRILVIYVVDDERRAGFAWGTSDDAGAVGEQLFFVEHREDDTVWAVARGFLSAPKNGLLGLKARAHLKVALDAVKRQIAALAPGVLTGQNGDGSSAADAAEPVDGAAEAGTVPGRSEAPGADDSVDEVHVAAPGAPAPDLPAPVRESDAPAEPDTMTAVIVLDDAQQDNASGQDPDAEASHGDGGAADKPEVAEVSGDELAGSPSTTEIPADVASSPADAPLGEAESDDDPAPEADPDSETDPDPEVDPDSEVRPDSEGVPLAEDGTVVEQVAVAGESLAPEDAPATAGDGEHSEGPEPQGTTEPQEAPTVGDAPVQEPAGEPADEPAAENTPDEVASDPVQEQAPAPKAHKRRPSKPRK